MERTNYYYSEFISHDMTDKNYQNIFKFFDKNRFDDRDVVLDFFHNGWFAISKFDVISEEKYAKIYDYNAKLKLSFDEPEHVFFALRTGYILVRSIERDAFVLYRLNEEIKAFPFPNIERTKVTVFAGSAFSIQVGEYTGVINTSVDYRYIPTIRHIEAQNILGADFTGNIVYRDINNKIKTFYKSGKERELTGIKDVKLTAQATAIVLYDDFTVKLFYCKNILNFDKADVLLYSKSPDGIKELGHNTIIFEDALLACNWSGDLFSEYNKQTKIIDTVEKDIIIKPYVITDTEGKNKSFYPAETGKVYYIGTEYVFVFYYNSAYYVLPLYKEKFSMSKLLRDCSCVYSSVLTNATLK